MSPVAGCPACGAWSPRREWRPAEPDRFSFEIVCPQCGVRVDVHDIGYRLGSAPPAPPPPTSAPPPRRS